MKFIRIDCLCHVNQENNESAQTCCKLYSWNVVCWVEGGVSFMSESEVLVMFVITDGESTARNFSEDIK
jgi:hypothetical protein